MAVPATVKAAAARTAARAAVPFAVKAIALLVAVILLVWLLTKFYKKLNSSIDSSLNNVFGDSETGRGGMFDGGESRRETAKPPVVAEAEKIEANGGPAPGQTQALPRQISYYKNIASILHESIIGVFDYGGTKNDTLSNLLEMTDPEVMAVDYYYSKIRQGLATLAEDISNEFLIDRNLSKLAVNRLNELNRNPSAYTFTDN